MAKVKVKFRNSTVEGKAGVIYYQLCHKCQSRQITTGIRLFPEQWDALRERAVVPFAGLDGEIAVVQRQIDGDLCLFRAIIGDFEARRVEYGLPDVVGRFRSFGRVTVFAFIEKQIACLRAGGRLGTARNYRRTLNSFAGFLNGADIPFSLLDEQLVSRYDDWLRRRRIVRNTVSFYMRVLRAVFNKAVREGIVSQSSPFRNVYTGVDRTRKRAVGEETVIRLRRLNLEHSPSLALARDIFIFSYCARGMAFVDIAFLRKQDIAGGAICYVRRKTGQRLTIRIEPCMGDIIERYAPVTRTSDYVFPLLNAGTRSGDSPSTRLLWDTTTAGSNGWPNCSDWRCRCRPILRGIHGRPRPGITTFRCRSSVREWDMLRRKRPRSIWLRSKAPSSIRRTGA